MYTVEPPIMDTPKEDKPLYKGHYSRHQIILSLVLIQFEPPRRGQPLYKGQRCRSQSVLYLEVPLYICNPSKLINFNVLEVLCTKAIIYV